MANSVSELSGQATAAIDAGEWGKAATLVAAAWRENSPPGFRPCSLPDYPDVWVRYKARGYPYSLRRKWQEAAGEVEILELTLPYIEAWSLTGADSQPVALPDGARTAALLDAVDIALVFWLVRDFGRWIMQDLTAVPKG